MSNSHKVAKVVKGPQFDKNIPNSGIDLLCRRDPKQYQKPFCSNSGADKLASDCGTQNRRERWWIWRDIHRSHDRHLDKSDSGSGARQTSAEI
jgi:hypothetical protein